MSRVGNTSGSVETPAPAPRQGSTRRSFLRRVGLLGMGAAALSAGAERQAEAQYGSGSVDDLSKEQLVKMYEDMLKIRLWESKVKDLLLGGGFRGVAHLYVGEEAIAVGVCHALGKDDYIASTHRGHGHLIAKGGDMGLMLAEITHKATGYCKGYGGSLHITDVGLGILGMNGIVGASHLFGAGAAYGIKVKGTDQVAVSFGGDGSIQGNFFSSAANAAAAWKLPWIGVIENNGYQIWVRAADVYGIVDLAQRADGYGIEGRVVDGNDVLAVYNAARYAVQARSPVVRRSSSARLLATTPPEARSAGTGVRPGLSLRPTAAGWPGPDRAVRNTLTSDGMLSDSGPRRWSKRSARRGAGAQLPSSCGAQRRTDCNVFAQGTVPLHTS